MGELENRGVFARWNGRARAKRRGEQIERPPPFIIAVDGARTPALPAADAPQLREGQGGPQARDVIRTVTPVHIAAVIKITFRIHCRGHPTRIAWNRFFPGESAKMPQARPGVGDRFACSLALLDPRKRSAMGRGFELKQ